MKRFFIVIFILIGVNAQAKFDWNQNCQKAYTEIINLRFTNGKEFLEIEKQKNPRNLLPYFIENYIDFLTIQIGEEERDFNRLKENKNNRLNIIKKGDESSPWFLYSQAEIHLQWAGNRLKFEEYLTAAYEINKAYRLLTKNQQIHPDFILNMKSLGILHSLIGSIPNKYSWALSTIGMEGSVNQGMNEMQSLIDSAKKNTEYAFIIDETYFMYSFLKMNLQNDPIGLQLILNEIKRSNNLLLNFAACQLASKLGKNDLAISILENRTQNSTHYPFYYLEYLLGVFKQNKLNPNAIKHFEKYVTYFEGQNYIKSAYMRISWHYLLLADFNNFKQSQDNINNYGNTLVDSDKEAQFFFEKRSQPNLQLLKSRLLFDGGYHQKALKSLKKIKNPVRLSNVKHIIEYFYRKARIYDEMQKISLAKENYQKTIDLGRNTNYFFAAKSALQLGIIYEKNANNTKAVFYFNECIAMEDHEYEQSLEQKAKAGLNRLK